jgi:hypothetical protein
MNIQIINPIEFPTWDDLLLTHPETTFFHTVAWAKVLSKSYGYKPLYFTIIDDGRVSGLIPVMEIDSFLTGKRGVSLPFTDLCNPIARDPDVFARLFEAVIAYGRKAGWKNLEIRGGKVFLEKEPPTAQLVVHTLALSPEEADVSKAFRDSTYRNIRKAQKEGVAVNLEHSSAAMASFYRLHCETRRHHGLPPQPWSFFDKIQEHIIAKGNGFVALAMYKGQSVSGAIFFNFNCATIFKYGASDKTFQHLRPNNLLLWQAIEWCSESGFRSFHFGRTEPENEGLLQFKDGWGAAKAGLCYYKYDLRKGRFLSNDSGPKSSYRVFKMMPAPLLRLTGNLLYRHVG